MKKLSFFFLIATSLLHGMDSYRLPRKTPKTVWREIEEMNAVEARMILEWNASRKDRNQKEDVRFWC